MSKVNRRQEIKKKEELQARFQLAVSQTNKKILNWLQPNDTISENHDEKQSFLSLPIIPQGSGLSNIEKQNNCIGDFINSDENKLKQFQSNDVNKNLRKPTSKPMMALMNKMRNSNRDKIKKNHVNHQKHKPKPQNLPIDNSDSEEEMISKSRTVKKSSNLLFEPKGKKKGRPF